MQVKLCSYTLLVSDFVICFEFKHHSVQDASMMSFYKLWKLYFLILVSNSLFCFMNKHRATFLQHFVSIKAVLVHFFAIYFSVLNFWIDRWMDKMGLTSDELGSGLLPTVWDSARRLIRKQLVLQFWSLNKWPVHNFAKVPPEVLFDRERGGHCTRDWFHIHQVPLHGDL